MAQTLSLTTGANSQGFSQSFVKTPTAAYKLDVEKSVVASQAGTLTVRTNNTDGSITATIGSGHGISTADRVDLWWDVGGVRSRRRGVTVGTVAGAVIPITGGSGDNLPSASAAINVAKCTSFAFVVSSDLITGFAFQHNKGGQVTLLATATEKYTIALDAGAMDSWPRGDNRISPITATSSLTIGHVSNEDLVNVATFLAVALFN